MTRLRQRMIDDMRIRNLAANTQETYLIQVSVFARHFGRSPEILGFEHVREYQLHLVKKRNLAVSSIAVAVAALRFLYRVTLRKNWNFDDVMPSPQQPRKLPVILSPEEVAEFLACVRHVRDRAILTVCYATGMRISEAVHLKVSDIDSKRAVIRIDQGKGARDRYVMLSPPLLEVLRKWWKVHQPKHWLFEGESGEPIQVKTVQRACSQARPLCSFNKPISPHLLRHAFAVHLLESGADVRTIQLLMGHRSLATTCKYLHLSADKVCATVSPFDRVAPLLKEKITPGR